MKHINRLRVSAAVAGLAVALVFIVGAMLISWAITAFFAISFAWTFAVLLSLALWYILALEAWSA